MLSCPEWPRQKHVAKSKEGVGSGMSGGVTHERNPGAGMLRRFFGCSYEVAELGRHLGETEKFEFNVDRPRPCVVRLSKSCWDRQPSDSVNAICTAQTGEEAVDDATESGKDIHDELSSAMIPAVALFLWRYGLTEGPPNPCRNLRRYTSNDGKSWCEVPPARASSLSLSFGIPYRSTFPPRDVIRNDMAELVRTENNEEPLGRQLFKEAWSERETRPRSALVIGVAAAEVGFKKLVGRLVPHAQWLMDEIQTPPLGTMLRKFLPTLPVKFGRPPGVLLNQLDEAIKRRNKLVHAGAPPPNKDELEKILRAINDFLWMCDMYAGHSWAQDYISVETRIAWAAAPRRNILTDGQR